jgi:PadR family transcriptional regulator, regulatory protein PadR
MAGSDLFTGTLDVLILKALSAGPQHGYAIGLWLRQRSAEVLQVEEGVLYPALHRLLRNKWVKAKWDVTETNRRARFYSLTSPGRKHLSAETRRLTEHSEAVLTVLGALRS